MVKIFTLLNVAGLLLFNMLFVSDVSIVQDMPAKIDPGTEVRVSVTINKDHVSGFAKLQIDLPPGLSATAIETKGASFTFAEGKAKFIWMALPTQPSFKVSYTLSADPTASGSLPITARLSYIEDNERKTVDMMPTTIQVGDGGVPNAGVASNTEGTAPAAPAGQNPSAGNMDNTAHEMMNGNEATEQVAQTTPETAPMVPDAVAAKSEESTIPDAIATETPGLPSVQGPGNVSATRTVTPVGNNGMLVEVTVQKGSLRGFGKLQETIPPGFSAVAKEKDDAIFSTKGRVAKFIWLNLPSKNTLTVTYRLMPPMDASGEYTVNGEFGYLVDDLTQRAVVGSSTFKVEGGAMAMEQPATTAPESTPTPPAKETVPETQAPEVSTPAASSPATTTASTPPVKEEEPARPATAQETVTAQSSRPKVSHVPAPEHGITYKVQITAAHREVGKPYFIKRHHYSGDFSIERNEGWIKYVTGMFDRYRSARDQRQAYIDANYNFPGPFVTAYNNGERITVQEALMIAKQHSAQ